MADSKRQDIIDALDTRLRTILTAGGYETDLGSNVFEWRATALQESELPGLIYRDISCEPVENTASLYQEFFLNIEVEIITVSGSTTASQIRKMIADVYKAIGTDDKWGGLALGTFSDGDEMNIEQAEKIIGGATVSFHVHFATVEWDPYN